MTLSKLCCTFQPFIQGVSVSMGQHTHFGERSIFCSLLFLLLCLFYKTRRCFPEVLCRSNFLVFLLGFCCRRTMSLILWNRTFLVYIINSKMRQHLSLAEHLSNRIFVSLVTQSLWLNPCWLTINGLWAFEWDALTGVVSILFVCLSVRKKSFTLSMAARSFTNTPRSQTKAPQQKYLNNCLNTLVLYMTHIIWLITLSKQILKAEKFKNINIPEWRGQFSD